MTVTPYFAQDGVTYGVWRGKSCEVVGFQDITTSTGERKSCAEIKLIGIPLHQGWRLVDAADLCFEKHHLTRRVKSID